MSSDDLLPLPDDEVKAPTETEPALMKEAVAFEVIDAYPLEKHNIPIMKATANFALQALFMVGCKALDEVKVLRMSKEKPWLFQVRSQKAFSKNELVLMP